MRDGTLSRNGLVTWMLYVYHLSRSAAMSASRSAVRLPDRGLRAVFAESALEEYAHCEEHFFVRPPSVPLEAEQVRRSVHLPAGVAFDHQMLRLAEDDGLGHVLAGLFQESTARFYDQCRTFYGEVASAYDLGGFFGPWERHVEIDLGEGHADDFARVLDSDERCSRDELVRAVHGAWLTFGCLLGGLDDVLACDRNDDQVVLRSPIDDTGLDPAGNALLARYADVLGGPRPRIDAASPFELRQRLSSLGLGRDPTATAAVSGQDLAFVRADVALTLFRGLSHATEHEEILLFGRLAEHALGAAGLGEDAVLGGRLLPRSYRAGAFASFLREHATRPVELAYLLRHAAALAPEAVPVDEQGRGALDAFLAQSDMRDARRLATRTLQLNELHAAWVAAGDAPPVDFFRD